MKDSDAKAVMMKWPAVTSVLFGGSEDFPWIRAQPRDEKETATSPFLLQAGNEALRTQPDGMFIRPVKDFQAMDVVSFEVCSSLQNMNDKRSRYAATTSALVVDTREGWWRRPVQGRRSRWQKVTNGLEDWGDAEDFWSPVRYLRVVYVLSKTDLERFRADGVAAGHEYLMRFSSLASISSQNFRVFLDRLSPDSHFYTK